MQSRTASMGNQTLSFGVLFLGGLVGSHFGRLKYRIRVDKEAELEENVEQCEVQQKLLLNE